MALNPGQAEVSANSSRFKVVVAGRRWGKTTLSIRDMARVARQPDQRVWYIAPSYRMAKQIVWDKMKARLYDLNWITRVNESDLTVRLRNNSTISLRGADNPDSLRGVALNHVIFDEAAMIESKAWYEVIRPTLSDTAGSAMFISTPMGRNWLFDLYQRGLDPTEDQWSSFTYTTLEGGNVTEDEIQMARRDMDNRQFQQEYEANFVTYAGVIYYNFSRELNLLATDAVSNQILVGMDFNVSPMSAVLMQKTNLGLHVFDEIVIYGSNTEEMVEEIRRRYPHQTIIVYPDPAGVQRKSSAGGRTDITILQNAGFQVKYRTNHPPVRDRINAVNALMLNADGDRRLTIDPSCKRTIESLEKQTYKEDTQIPDKDDGYDHMNDALGYAVEYMFPVRRDMPESAYEPQRWGVQTMAAR